MENNYLDKPENTENNTKSSLPETKGVYLNGKKQVIELLRALDNGHKEILLKNMSARNRTLTNELGEQSLSFNNLFQLSDDSIKTLFQYIDPTIVGLALYYTNTGFQRRVLSLIAKENAQKAFNILQANLMSKKDKIIRAQEKVLQVAIELKRRNIISL